MTKSCLRALAPAWILTLALGSGTALAADDHVYTEGNVLDVTSIRTKPGMFDEYMKFVSNAWRKEQEELKKQGLVVDYAVYEAIPRSPADPDLYLVVTYRNMAAFDMLMEKSEAVEKTIFGSMAAGQKAAVDRESIRTILGSQVIRQLNLKPAGK